MRAVRPRWGRRPSGRSPGLPPRARASWPPPDHRRCTPQHRRELRRPILVDCTFGAAGIGERCLAMARAPWRMRAGGRGRPCLRRQPASDSLRRLPPIAGAAGRRTAPRRPERETSLHHGTIGRRGGACCRCRSGVGNCRARTAKCPTRPCAGWSRTWWAATWRCLGYTAAASSAPSTPGDHRADAGRARRRPPREWDRSPVAPGV